MTARLRFFPPRHPVHRLSDEMKAEFIEAQNSIRSVAFPDALSFCERILSRNFRGNKRGPNGLRPLILNGNLPATG